MIIMDVNYLYPCADDDAHEEVGDDAGDGHHEALHDGDAGVEAEEEEEVVHEARVEAHHEVAQRPRQERDEDQERHRRQCVAHHERQHAVVPVQPLPLEHLNKSTNKQTTTQKNIRLYYIFAMSLKKSFAMSKSR